MKSNQIIFTLIDAIEKLCESLCSFVFREYLLQVVKESKSIFGLSDRAYWEGIKILQCKNMSIVRVYLHVCI